MAEIENLKIGNGTIHIVGNQDIVADSWEAGKTYVADRSYVIREHILYVCNTTHTSVEPFDPTKWTATTIGEALGMAGSANVIECTLAEYTAWKAGGLLINETTYILTDAPNLNATAQDLSYDGGATSTHDVIEQATGYKQLYSKSTYQNDVGQTIALSETSANFRFLRISVYINDTSYSNAGMLLVANIKSGIQVQHFPLCINAVLGSMRIDLSGTSLKLYSTSFGSTMFISQVVGIY